MTHFVLKLYITGQSPRSEQAIANLRKLCERELDGRCELSIIDVLERPRVAEAENVLATPTLVKELPPPPRRIVGDLSDVGRVLAALGLEAKPTATD